MTELLKHRELAAALRGRVAAAKGETDRSLRTAAVNRATGGEALAAPYDALVVQIATDATGVTDEQVAAVRAAAGSDKAAFEIIMAAAIGAGLLRFERALRAIEDADAPR